MFENLGLDPDILKAIADAGYSDPTPIQAHAIPVVLSGRDVLGCAQTGTGKTASFTLPMIQKLSVGRARARMPRSLVLTPTRELAAQISQNFVTYAKYHKLEMALLIGGVSAEEQQRKLARSVDVLIATPGRLLDLFDRGSLLLNDAKFLVIDEADRMLDMGFIPDVEKIVGLLPSVRQTMMFSATMPSEIRNLANKFLINPKEISVAPPSTTADTVKEYLVQASPRGKNKLLLTLLQNEQVENALIFCNKKVDVDLLDKYLRRHNFLSAALHGDMNQSIREETLALFKAGNTKLLVATDVAGRGLDILGLSHVFNFDVPLHAEDYVHRIGRTGRAGKTGFAFTISTKADEKFVSAIIDLIGHKIPPWDTEITKTNNFEAKIESKKQAKKTAIPTDNSSRSPSARKETQGKGRSLLSRKKNNDRQHSKTNKPRNAKNSDKTTGWGNHTPAFIIAPPRQSR